jgi:hypothetical protein
MWSPDIHSFWFMLSDLSYTLAKVIGENFGFLPFLYPIPYIFGRFFDVFGVFSKTSKENLTAL